MRGLGNGRQSCVIQPALDHTPISVPNYIGDALLVDDLNGAARRGAHPNGKDHDVLLSQLLGGANARLFEILPVGEQDHDFAAVVLLHRPIALIESAPDVRARDRDGLLVLSQEGLAEGVIVERERALQKGLARKGDQPHSASPMTLHKIENRILVAPEPIRPYVLRQHAPETNENEQDDTTQSA